MAWLVRHDEALAPLEIATTFAARSRGLLGRDGIDGAIWLKPATSVHTLGMRFDLDIAFCDADLVVLDTLTMVRHRLGLPRRRARSVIEAEAGAFERWTLGVGDHLEIQP